MLFTIIKMRGLLIRPVECVVLLLFKMIRLDIVIAEKNCEVEEPFEKKTEIFHLCDDFGFN